jgi:hypothetical protein
LVGAALNQATRQVGSVMGVAITVGLLGHANLVRTDFNWFYVLHAGAQEPKPLPRYINTTSIQIATPPQGKKNLK